MKLLLIGATGRMGGFVLDEAIARGHTVTALARDPSPLAGRPGVRAIAGDVRDAAILDAALSGQDAVVTTLGPRRGAEGPSVLSEGMAALVAAMGRAGVRRVVALGAAGILQRDAASLRRDAPGYPASFLVGSGEHLKAYRSLEASNLDWTIVAPPELVAGDRDQPIIVLEDYLPEGPKRIAMPALAKLIVDELESPRHLRRRLGMIDA